jgi:molecular chaperone DnaJ
MPSLRGNYRGNLLVRINVKIPKKLNSQQRELLEAFSETEGSRSIHKKKSLWEKIKQ